MTEHNPIAFAISLLQDKWKRSVENKDFEFVRWIINREDFDIFKGFLKLESTSYGHLEETFVVMLTPFEASKEYAKMLVVDWIDLFEKEATLCGYNQWKKEKDYKSLLKSNQELDDTISIFADFLRDFKKYEGKKSKLVLTLMPYAVTNVDEYNFWIQKFLKNIPEKVALMTIESMGEQTQDDFFGKRFPKHINITATNLFNSADIYKQLATSGDLNDPQVAFRQCLFEMGTAAKNKNKSKVYQWGNKALVCTQQSGDKLFWASAHIVFAGFLFSFEDVKKIEELLDKGIYICEELLLNEEKITETVGLLAQFYGYKGISLNLQRKYEKSIDWFEKQADILEKHNQIVMAIGAYQNALLMAHRSNKERIKKIVDKAFPIGYKLDDDLLRASAFPIIAYWYLQKNSLQKEEISAIRSRLSYLYTDNWELSAKKHFVIVSENYIK
ncbi:MULTISPECIES: hypothetical protein [Capnocytophaga]|uniref:Uncharacterized protein n=1 Tax=Capnocytophaga canis TaxID=1848903 RepID=A0A3A1Y9U8_9FLAO|nr:MULTISPECIES: hypothetical protein [Capnocytophaga]RIY34932.1 hypothetical protein CKY20_11580 [Capnocytophaga canis]